MAAVTPLVSACLPGVMSGDSGPDAAISANADVSSPSVNRSYKTSFFGSASSSDASRYQTQAALSSDTDANILTAAISTVGRKISQASFSATPPAVEADSVIAPAPEALKLFYTALSDLSGGKRIQPVTILHLGDENVADDRFAGDIRENLQSRFGNAGRGLMSPGLFPARGFKIDRGGEWAIESSAAGAPGNYDLTGVRATAKSDSSWLRLTATQGTFDWAEVTFATGPSQGSAIVSIDGDSRTVPTASPARNQTSIKIATKAREILIKPAGNGEIAVLSVATGTAGKGIRYVNLGLPGATALTPGKWNAALIAADLDKLKPDLIVFGYGSREAFLDGIDSGEYERRLYSLVRQISEMAPQASLLVIGPPDAARLPAFANSAAAQVCRGLNVQEAAIYDRMLTRSDERLARWHAPPALERIRAGWKRTAAVVGAYYWDWARFMGGPCSIHAWTTARPPLAAPDHVTFTMPGMERSARGLFNELMAGYEVFLHPTRAAALVANAEPAAAPDPQPKKRKAGKAKKKTDE